MRQGAWFGVLTLAGVSAAMAPAIVLAASGGGTGFDAIVQGIESRYHAHANRIPFMGLIGLVAGHATPGGVRGLHVATIENLTGPVDGAELNALVAGRAGPGWQRIVRETSRSAGEQNLIYVKPEGDRMGMLAVDLDDCELNVVEVSIDPNKLSEKISEHRHGRDSSQRGQTASE